MKNGWKKTLSLLLCLVLLAGLFPAALAESGTISLVQEGRNLNLRACVAGTNARYIVAKVYQGGSYTMSVDASVDEGGIRYRWSCADEYYASMLPTDESTDYVWLSNIQRKVYVSCQVLDDEDNSIVLGFTIKPDTGLTATVEYMDTQMIYLYACDRSQYLAVEAESEEGEVSYQWQKSTRSQIHTYQDLEGETESSLTVDATTEACNYRCLVTDGLGGEETVYFYLRPDSLAKDLPYNTKTAFESDPELGEITIRFQAERDGVYLLSTDAGDPTAYCLVPETSYSILLPFSFGSKAGILNYFTITGDTAEFSLHLTIRNKYYRTLNELKELLASCTSQDTFTYVGTEDPFVITEDLTIPAMVSLPFGEKGLTVADGAELMVGSDSTIACGTLTVDGAIQNNGDITCTSLSGKERIQSGENSKVYVSYLAETEEALHALLDQSAADPNPHFIFEALIQQPLTLTENLYIPAYTLLSVKNSVTVPQGVILEVSSQAEAKLQVINAGSILLQGTLRNNGGFWLYYPTGLVLEEGGLYCGNGVIQAPKWNGTVAEFFPWLSLPEYSDYTVSADGGWYFVSREVTAEPGDVNGDGSIDSKDLLLLRKMLIGLPPEDAIVAPDVNGDGSFDIRDLVRMRRILAAMEQG